MNHPKSDTNQGTYEKDTLTEKKLYNTHTTKWMSPPIMKTKCNRYKIRRQPYKGVHLHFFENTIRIDYRIFEDTVISILPYCPSTRKSNNFKVRMNRSRHARYMNKLMKMILDCSWKNERNTKPLAD